MEKILSLSYDSLTKDQMDTLKEAVCPAKGDEKMLQWEFHDDGRLELYEEAQE